MPFLAGLIALLLWKTFSPWCVAKHTDTPKMQCPEAIEFPCLEEGPTFGHQTDAKVKEKAEASVPVYTLKY